MPDHRGLEPLTQSRAAQTAVLEVTAFIAMDAPFMGIAAGATRFNLTFPGVSGEYPLISERTDYAEKVRDALAQAGWDCLLKMKLPDTDEHMCRHRKKKNHLDPKALRTPSGYAS